MKSFSISSLCQTARQSLSQTAHAQRTVLIYTGAIVGLTILAELLNLLLGNVIDTMDSLSAVGNRTLLSTTQVILALLPSVLLPFWRMGYLHYTMQTIDGKSVPGNLQDGFRNWTKVISCGLLKLLPMVAVGYGLYALLGSFYLMAVSNAAALEAVVESGAIPTNLMLPLSILMTVTVGGSAIFFGYRFRLVDYCVMRQPKEHAAILFRRGTSLMRGRVGSYIKLDLHFWWYWLLEILAQGLLYLDLILSFFHISLPTPAAGIFCYALWGGMELLLSVFCTNRVSCTYAAAFAAVSAAAPTSTVPIQIEKSEKL